MLVIFSIHEIYSSLNQINYYYYYYYTQLIQIPLTPSLQHNQNSQTEPHDQHENGVNRYDGLLATVGQHEYHIAKVFLAIVASGKVEFNKVILVRLSEEGDLRPHKEYKAEQRYPETSEKHSPCKWNELFQLENCV